MNDTDKTYLINRRALLMAELEEVNKALEEIDKNPVHPVVEQHDNMNGQCEKCKEGKYIETSIYSNWDGWLECSHCSHRVDRFVPC